MKLLSKEELEEFKQLIEKLKSSSSCPNIVIIVEGQKDKSALKELGVRAEKIYTISHKSYESIARELFDLNIVDFLDEDKEGKHHIHELQKRGLYLNRDFKLKLFSLLGISRTEEILAYIYYLSMKPKDQSNRWIYQNKEKR